MRGQASRPAKVITTIELPTEGFTVVAAPPEMLSQRNVEAVTGIPARIYLEQIRSPEFSLPVAKVGKLRLVDRAAFVTYVRSLACEPSPANEGDGVAAALAEIGLEPARLPAQGRKLPAGTGRRGPALLPVQNTVPLLPARGRK